MMPLRSNIHATAPADPMLPPNFSKVCRISGPVRLRLSVRTPFGATGRPLPAPRPAPGARRKGRARLRCQVTAEMHVGQVRGAGVADLATPRLLGQDLDADLQR